MTHTQEDFCSRRFKPVIAVMVVLIIVIVGWTFWRLSNASSPASPDARAMLKAHPFVQQPAFPQGQQAHPYVLAPQQALKVPGLIVVAADGPGLNAMTSGQFESAAYFVLIDSRNQGYRVQVNPNAGLAGYGVQTAQLMANLRVSAVVAGGFGPDALATLGSLGIAAYPGVAASVSEAWTAYRGGSLRPAQTGAISGQAMSAQGQTKF